MGNYVKKTKDMRFQSQEALKTNASKERIDYLTSLNTLLQSAITDLKYDLGKV